MVQHVPGKYFLNIAVLHKTDFFCPDKRQLELDGGGSGGLHFQKRMSCGNRCVKIYFVFLFPHSFYFR